MNDAIVPPLTKEEIEEGLQNARNSLRHRHPMLLHKPGDEFNRVFNFMMRDSYMQPHLHPGEEKIEEIHLVEGRVATFFFEGDGQVVTTTILEKGGVECVKVPAFTWHTYIMLTDYAITYETMMGIYDSKTWKKFAEWAPSEDIPESSPYLIFLRNELDER